MSVEHRAEAFREPRRGRTGTVGIVTVPGRVGPTLVLERGRRVAVTIVQCVMNGQTQPEAMHLTAGTRYGFRLFNLAGDMPLVVTLNAADAPPPGSPPPESSPGSPPPPPITVPVHVRWPRERLRDRLLRNDLRFQALPEAAQGSNLRVNTDESTRRRWCSVSLRTISTRSP